MKGVLLNPDQLTAKHLLHPVPQILFVLFSALLIGAVSVNAQCPNSGETKVIKPDRGTGYYFYRFLGDSSFVYFLDGETFSYNDKDDPGRTFIFVGNIAYELTLVDRADLAKYVTSSKPEDILRAQAKDEQDYFKKIDPKIVITDYGPAYRQNPDGGDDRLFYLWKKENTRGKQAATQFMCSTPIKDGVVMLSLFSTKPSISEDDLFHAIQAYTSRFDLLSSEQCAKALSAPVAR